MAPQANGGCACVPPAATAAKARDSAALSQSTCCRKKRAEGLAPRDILYVNGINTSREAHCTTLHAIAEQTCARVIGIYNATEGFSADSTQTGQDRLLIKAAAAGKGVAAHDGRNKAVDAVKKFVIDERLAGRTPEIWAHSQGGAVTSLALFGARNTLNVESAGLSGIRVKSMGSAAPNWPDGPQYEHFVHVDDLTPTSFGLGHDSAEDAKRAGAGAKVTRFSGDPNAGQPFESANPVTNWGPDKTAYHGVEDTYLKMERQQNGGCP